MTTRCCGFEAKIELFFGQKSAVFEAEKMVKI
jgi:hypothetical protein